MTDDDYVERLCAVAANAADRCVEAILADPSNQARIAQECRDEFESTLRDLRRDLAPVTDLETIEVWLREMRSTFAERCIVALATPAGRC